MKKLLSILGAVGLVATTGATVVACGNEPKEKTFKGDDISQIERQWELKKYTTDTKNPKIWLTSDQYKINGDGEDSSLELNLDNKTLSQIIWTGILNADDGQEGTALKDFESKKLWTVLKFTGDVNNVIKNNFKLVEPNDKNEIIIELNQEESQKLGMDLTVDVISKTRSNTENKIVDVGLKASKTTFINGLSIHLILPSTN